MKTLGFWLVRSLLRRLVSQVTWSTSWTGLRHFTTPQHRRKHHAQDYRIGRDLHVRVGGLDGRRRERDVEEHQESTFVAVDSPFRAAAARLLLAAWNFVLTS
jgi:hypothetical protein